MWFLFTEVWLLCLLAFAAGWICRGLISRINDNKKQNVKQTVTEENLVLDED